MVSSSNIKLDSSFYHSLYDHRMTDASLPPPPNNTRYLGIDVGGTTIKFGLCDSHGAIRSKTSMPTDLLPEPRSVIQHGLEFALSALGASETLESVGLAVPGVLDTSSWSLKEVVNLPHWTNRPLLELLENESQRPSAIINDANAAALAEHHLRGLTDKSLALITLGTGIGCGLAVGGKGLSGDHGCAGEIGHLAINFSADANLCNCGRRGHLEAYAGAPAVIERAKKALECLDAQEIPSILRRTHLDPRDLSRAAEDGFQPAREIIIETGTYLGQAIGILGQVIDPAVVLLGGAMTFGGEAKSTGRDFLTSVKRSMADTTLQQVGSQMIIEYASLGNTAGVTGAALVALQKGRKS